MATRRVGLQFTARQQGRLNSHTLLILLQHMPGVQIDHRANVGRQSGRITQLQFPHRTGKHLYHRIGNILLQVHDAQRRTALPRALKGRSHHIIHYLLWQRRGINQHNVEAAGLGDKGDNGPLALSQLSIDQFRRACAAGKHHPRNTRVSYQTSTDSRAITRQQMQNICRYPRLQQKRDGTSGNEWRLFRRLRDDTVSCYKSSDNLAGKNGEGEIPGTDTKKYASSVQ